MREMNVVLFPVDFSEPSRRALPHVLEIARRFEAEIRLVHVRTPYSDDPNQPEYKYLDAGKYADYVEGRLEGIFQQLKASHRVSTEMVRNVSAASGILEYISEQEVDLVVMGTHGRSALSHFFLGSVAEKVVRHAPCLVLTVAHGREEYRDNPAYQKILVAFDFSEYSIEAARQAHTFARRFDAEVHLLYVVEQEIAPAYYDMWRIKINRSLDEIAEDARQELERSLGREGLTEIDFHVEVGDGDGRVYQEISRFARENHFDLLVLGTYGLSGMERILLGSTTERLVRAAPCPVLTVHRPES